jgi:Co/Zn/Cd efflux system component
MASAWECSRNDVFEGLAVIGTVAAVWVFESGWPDLIGATALLILFFGSAGRVLRAAWRGLAAPAPQH